MTGVETPLLHSLVASSCSVSVLHNPYPVCEHIYTGLPLRRGNKPQSFKIQNTHTNTYTRRPLAHTRTPLLPLPSCKARGCFAPPIQNQLPLNAQRRHTHSQKDLAWGAATEGYQVVRDLPPPPPGTQLRHQVGRRIANHWYSAERKKRIPDHLTPMHLVRLHDGRLQARVGRLLAL